MPRLGVAIARGTTLEFGTSLYIYIFCLNSLDLSANSIKPSILYFELYSPQQ